MQRCLLYFALLAIPMAVHSQTTIGPLGISTSEHIWQASGSFYSSGLVGGNVLLTLGRYNNFPYRLFCQWSLPNSLIPDGSVITQARLQFTASPQSGSPQFGGGIFKVNYDLNGSTPYGTLFAEADNPANVLGTAGATGGVVDQTFSQGTFTDAIAAGLPNDRFTIVFKSGWEPTQPYWWYVFTGSIQLTIWFIPPGTVIADQVFETNTRVVGSSIGHYDYNQSRFVPYLVPHTFSFNLNNIETLRADTSLWPNPLTSNLEKYRTWNGLSDVINHKNFLIQLGFRRAESQFKAATNATVQAELLEGGNPGGSIDFKDPWLIDDNSDPKGPRNRGVNAIWYNRPSPFNITTFNPSYRGVFLNQEIASGLPYYSVGAPSPQQIGGYTSHFSNWTGHPDSVGYQNAAAQQTAVVFKRHNARAVARYKAHLASSLPTATSTNSQRKLARVKWQASWGIEETYYLVYESGGEIWLTESIDYGSSWSPEVRVSDGTGNFSAPSVAAVDRNGGTAATGGGEGNVRPDLQVYVVYRKQVGSQYQIISRIRVPGQGNSHLWLAPQVISQSGFTPTTLDVRPIIAYHTTYGFEQLLAAWEATDGIRERTASNSNGTWYWGTRDGYFMVANTPGCKSPSLSNKHGNGFHQLWGALVYEGDVLAGPVGSNLWPVTDNGEYINSRNPTVAFDAVGRVHLSWVAFDRSRGMDVVVHRSSDDPYTPNWSPFYVIIDDFGDPSQLTASVLAHDDAADGGVSVEWANGSNFVFTNYAPDGVNFKDWRWASFGSSVVSPNASHISRPDYDFAVLTLDTQPLSTITHVTFGMPYSPVSSPASPTSSRSKSKLYRSILLQDTTARSQVRLQLGNIVLTRGNDTINSQIRFEKFRNRAGQGFIRSESFRVSQQNVKATMSWEGIGQNLRHRLTVALNLIDSASGNVIATLNDYSISPNRRIDVRRKLNENLPLRSAPMYIAMSIQGLPESMYKTSLANIEEIEFGGSRSSNVSKRNGETASSAIKPIAFAVHNAYPNPFNPSAQINFDLPEASQVSLIVYDVLGRKVAELENGMKEAGYHSATWDASNVASGVYFARFRASDANGNVRLSKVNKLLLTK